MSAIRPAVDADTGLLAIIDADLAVAGQALEDAARFVSTRARPWFEAGGSTVAEEPTVLHEAGRVAVDLETARALRNAAALSGAPGELAGARLLAGLAARGAVRFLFATGGTSTADAPDDFGRHWRAALHNATLAPLEEARRAAGEHALGQAPLFAGGVRPAAPPFDVAGAIRAADHLASVIAQGAAARDRQPAHPQAELDLLARSGLLGVSVPRRFGGSGLDLPTGLEVARRISYGDSSIGQILTIHYSVLETLLSAGSDAQKAYYLPRIAAGARLGNAAAERGVAHAKVTATSICRRADGDWAINGRKFYSTGAPGAQFVCVLGLDEAGRFVTAIVPSDAPGLSILDDWKALGQRITGSGTTILDDIRLPDLAILARGLATDTPDTGSAAANLAHVAIDLGIGRAALDDAVALRRADAARLGEPAARLAGAEALFAAACNRLRALRHETLTGELVQAFSLQVSVVKVLAGELAMDIGETLLDIAGDGALDPASGLDRHWRNARTHSLHDPNRWRYLRIGDHAINSRLPPRNRTN